MLVNPVLERLLQADYCVFKTGLDYIAVPRISESTTYVF